MARDTGEKVLETVSDSTGKVAEMAHGVVDRVAKRAEQAEHGLREGVDKTGRELKRSLRKARVRSRAARKSMGDFVQVHPLATAAMALGAGLVLSLLFRGGGRSDEAKEEQ
jgi:ElaB/YqjD/DUF883 family membrane-anchored ribosome-binding protein